MTQLFFMDESGHDHKNMPYEVRGGFSIHVSKLWPFVQKMQQLEIECFGKRLEEIKGSILLKKDVFKWAGQAEEIPNGIRKELVREFLNNKSNPKRVQFTAYGQASLKMAQGIVELLMDLDSVIFAAAIPRGTRRPPNYQLDDFLRKDHVFLFERFFYLLEEKNEHGVIVMDETEKKQDSRFVTRMEQYFSKTENGRERAERIVPAPFFVSSDMAVAVQVADLCIYAINWGFRLPERGMNAQTRPEITKMFKTRLKKLQYYRGKGLGLDYTSFGITFVRNPYEAKKRKQ